MAKEKLTYPYPAKFPESVKLKLLELAHIEDRSANKVLALAVEDRYEKITKEKGKS